MGLTIVLIFILCHSIKWIPNIYELVRLSSNDKRRWPHWIESITHVAHFLMSLNSSVNFYVYCVKHFRVASCCGRAEVPSHSSHGGRALSLAGQSVIDPSQIAGSGGPYLLREMASAASNGQISSKTSLMVQRPRGASLSPGLERSCNQTSTSFVDNGGRTFV